MQKKKRLKNSKLDNGTNCQTVLYCTVSHTRRRLCPLISTNVTTSAFESFPSRRYMRSLQNMYSKIYISGLNSQGGFPTLYQPMINLRTAACSLQPARLYAPHLQKRRQSRGRFYNILFLGRLHVFDIFNPIVRARWQKLLA